MRFLIMLPLFPKDDQPITIEQGRVGDCYLLAAIDCLYNSKDGKKRLTNMFTELSNGDIEVRIQYSKQSQYLKPEKVKLKYQYKNNIENDIITIPKDRLELIAKDQRGVKTNSLAVLILEHLSPYFFTVAREDSLLAHNHIIRYEGTDADFIAKLVGFEAGYLEDINQVIKLKTIAPHEPVYLTLDYGQQDRRGVYHSRHALRVDKITPNPQIPGGYEFSLVNPWNTRIIETWSQEDIKKRRPKYACFYKNKEKKAFSLKILSIPEHEAGFIFNHSELKENLFSLFRTRNDVNTQFLLNGVSLYKRFPSIFDKIPSIASRELSIFNSSIQKDALIVCLKSSSGQFENNYKLLIKKCFPNTDFASQEEVNKLTDLINQNARRQSGEPIEKPEEKIMDFYFLQDFERLPPGNIRNTFIHPETIAAVPQLKKKLLARGLHLLAINDIGQFGVDGKDFLKSEHHVDQQLYKDIRAQEKNILNPLKSIFNVRAINPSLSKQLLKLAKEDLAKTNVKTIKTMIDKQPDDAFKAWLKSMFDSDIELRTKWNNNLALEIRALLKDPSQLSSLPAFFEKINNDDFINKYIKVYEKHFGIVPKKEIGDIVLNEWQRKMNNERHQRKKPLGESTPNDAPVGNLNLLFKPFPQPSFNKDQNNDNEETYRKNLLA